MPSPDAVESFITRWENSGAAERANYQMFLAELCDILEVPRPDPTSPDPAKNLYVFDRAITRMNPDGTSVTNYIDLYKAHHFVNETKQGVSDCSVGLRPSLTTSGREATESKMDQTDSASPAPGNGIDGHRPPLQNELPGTEASSSHPQSTIHDPRSPAWPERLPAQVTLIRQLLASDPNATAEQLSARFGRKNPKRTEQIEGILETLKGLGQL